MCFAYATALHHTWGCRYYSPFLMSERKSHSVVSDSENAMDCVARQASLSMEFSRPEHRSGYPFPSPEDLPNPGIEPRSLTLQVDSLLSEPPGKSFTDED